MHFISKRQLFSPRLHQEPSERPFSRAGVFPILPNQYLCFALWLLQWLEQQYVCSEEILDVDNVNAVCPFHYNFFKMAFPLLQEHKPTLINCTQFSRVTLSCMRNRGGAEQFAVQFSRLLTVVKRAKQTGCADHCEIICLILFVSCATVDARSCSSGEFWHIASTVCYWHCFGYLPAVLSGCRAQLIQYLCSVSGIGQSLQRQERKECLQPALAYLALHCAQGTASRV